MRAGDDDKKKKRRSSMNPKREESSKNVSMQEKDEHIRMLEKRLHDLMLKNREVKTLRDEVAKQRKRIAELEETHHQNKLMWLIATGNLLPAASIDDVG